MILLIFLIQIQDPTVVWERLMVGLISYREVTEDRTGTSQRKVTQPSILPQITWLTSINPLLYEGNTVSKD